MYMNKREQLATPDEPPLFDIISLNTSCSQLREHPRTVTNLVSVWFKCQIKLAVSTFGRE